MNLGGLGDDRAMADSPAGFVKCVSEDCQEDYWCNEALEGKEPLYLRVISKG